MLFIGYILEYNLFEVCFEIMKHNSSRTMLRSFSEKLSLCEPLLYIHTYIHKHMEMLQMDVQKKSKDIIIIFLHFCKIKLWKGSFISNACWQIWCPFNFLKYKVYAVKETIISS